MNIAKFYKLDGRNVTVNRVRFSGNQGNDSTAPGIAAIEETMMHAGYTHRRPSLLKPHFHPAQRPGYRQPSEHRRRNAQQLLRKKRAA